MVFVVAARTAEVTAPLTGLVPLGLVVLVAAANPLSLAGWGRAKAPRRGSSPRSAAAARPVLRPPSPTASSRWSPRFPALPY
jgi:glycosyltransferase 2 family protein